MKISKISARSYRQWGQSDNQEDNRYPDVDAPNNNQRFFLVCDGVGGCVDGEIASKTVCEAFARKLSLTDLTQDFTNEMFAEALDAAYDALDKKAKTASPDMATTMTLLVLHGKGATMAHIGDSRIYQIRPGEGIIYKSNDHSLVNSMVHSGLLTPEQAHNHPKSNIITRYMGPVEGDGSRHMATVLRNMDVCSDDWFILCTDGVVHCISDERLEKIIDDDTSIDDKIGIMAKESFDSTDNNTCMLVHVGHVEPEESDILPHQSQPADGATRRLEASTFDMTDIESVKRRKATGALSWFKKIFN